MPPAIGRAKAEALSVQHRTVETLKKSMVEKPEVNSVTEASFVAFAILSGVSIRDRQINDDFS